MSLLDSIKKGLMGEGDEYEDQYIDDGPQMVNNNSGVGIGMDEETEEPAEGASKKNKVVNIHATTQLKVVLVKPERFEDASTIADHLNNKRTVVLNLESTNKEVSRRLVDAGRAGEQWCVLLILRQRRSGALCLPAMTRNAFSCGMWRTLPGRHRPAASPGIPAF